jgi:mannose-6-phosphate isomerase-like protein (cupin superfamily)
MSGILDPAAPEGVVDARAWSAQALLWTERLRGRALWWPAGAEWFVNDPLGEMPHTHPRASELYFVAAGALDLTVGRDQVRVEAGETCMIPPDTFHNPRNGGAGDLCLFVIVAPNWRGERWKPDGFVDSDYEGAPTLGSVAADDVLLADERLRVEALTVGPGARDALGDRPAERVVYCLEGRLDVSVEHLGGTLGPHEYVHIPAGAAHRIAGAAGAPARVLLSEVPA